MITPAYVRTMAAYNRAMNERLYGAAARLTDAERRREQGAFFGSIHGTLSHLLWGDSIWLSRFSDWPKPAVPLKESPRIIEDFAELARHREKLDAAISAWAQAMDEAWLAADQTWVNSAGHQRTAPRALLVTHMFNHQTHHRGQAHALITRAGEKTGDTDLMIIVPEIVNGGPRPS
ncbi:MAG: DinB family protein [Acetobacteraceae bacterium]